MGILDTPQERYRLSKNVLNPSKKILGYLDGFGIVYEDDTYCIKHRELLIEWFDDRELSCAYCEWGDE